MCNNKSHLRYRQAHFKEPADGFVTKIMEAQVIDSYALLKGIASQL